MDYLGDNARLGLTSEQTEKMLQLQDLTGIEDITICRDVLQRHQWNLEVAVQEQLNIKEGRPSIYATETRPPVIINDHLGQHMYQSPPLNSSNGGSNLFSFIAQTLINFLYNACYNTIMTFLQLGQRMLGWERNGTTNGTNPTEDVLNFLHDFNEKYSNEHPVFYQGTFSQVLNDAKRELTFLLIYLHKDDSNDSEMFCRITLSNPEVISFVNSRFLFWACNQNCSEGKRTLQALKANNYRPFMAVLVLRENRMTVVGRIEGYSEPNVFLERLNNIVREFEINLVQTRADRFEASFNRSLRAYQDEAFEESLRADQEKERQREERRLAIEAEQQLQEEEARAEEERRQNIAREKIESANKVPSEPDSRHPDVIHIVVKLPCGIRLDRRFLRTHSLEAIYYYVFCHPNSPDSFEIITNFPKRVLKCRPTHPNERIMSLEEAGLKNREVLFVNDLDA